MKDKAQESKRLNEHVKRQHDKIQNLEDELANLQAKATSQLEVERKRHQTAIEEVVLHNKVLLDKTAERLKDVPRSLHVSSEVLRESRAAAEKVREKTEQQYEKLIGELNQSHDLKLENMRQQYEFLSEKKKTEQEKFVADFNKYLPKKVRKLVSTETSS